MLKNCAKFKCKIRFNCLGNADLARIKALEEFRNYLPSWEFYQTYFVHSSSIYSKYSSCKIVGLIVTFFEEKA